MQSSVRLIAGSPKRRGTENFKANILNGMCRSSRPGHRKIKVPVGSRKLALWDTVTQTHFYMAGQSEECCNYCNVILSS